MAEFGESIKLKRSCSRSRILKRSPRRMGQRVFATILDLVTCACSWSPVLPPQAKEEGAGGGIPPSRPLQARGSCTEEAVFESPAGINSARRRRCILLRRAGG